MGRLFTFIYAVWAGAAISIGGTAYLSLDNKIAGALFFSVGLFTIVTMGLNLFTGKVCYVFERDVSFAVDLPVIWLGNLAGAWLTAALIRMTRIAAPLVEKAAGLCEAKLGDGLVSIFILAVFCNLLIFIAVDNFGANKHDVGKYIALFMGVAVFILCGFEHCVANMFYFSLAGVWSGKTLVYLLVMTLGNAVGGWILPVSRQLKGRYLK